MQCILKMVWGPDDLNQGVGTTDAVFVENPTLKRLKGEQMKGREKEENRALRKYICETDSNRRRNLSS